MLSYGTTAESKDLINYTSGSFGFMEFCCNAFIIIIIIIIHVPPTVETKCEDQTELMPRFFIKYIQVSQRNLSFEFIDFSLDCFFFFFLSGLWKFLGQGLKLSHSCDLCCNCSSARSFNPLCWAGDQTHSFTATWIRFLTYCTTVGTPNLIAFYILKDFVTRENNYLSSISKWKE